MIQSLLGDKYTSKSVKAKVELYDGDTLVETCTCSKAEGIGNGAGALSDFKISRAGELGKYFGFGVSHKLEMTLIDLEKVLDVKEGYTAKICLGDGIIFDKPYPTLEITSVKVDKQTGDIKVSANDILYKAANHTFSELDDAYQFATPPYRAADIANACGLVLGIGVDFDNNDDAEVVDAFKNLVFAEGANYTGSESLRDVLNHLAEVTQTIYFLDRYNVLKFVRLRDFSVAKYYRQDYYSFEVGTAKALKGICSATELGDNLLAEIEGEGVIQYVRDNPLWELRTDIDTLLEESISRVGGLTLQQFELDWSGDYRLEVGDCITIYYDDEPTKIHILNDTITYAGTMDEETEWEYIVPVTETATNPTTIGDKINQTFARVDKVNREIELVASRADLAVEQVGSIKVATDNVLATVSELERTIDENSEVVSTLANEVSLKLDKEGVEITVEEILAEGVERVVTASKKYSFDDTGLNVSSSENSISTTILEDGMRIYRNGEEVLVADNEGVKAEDLHATTFLLIGENSRLQDWSTGATRTACFWIGE